MKTTGFEAKGDEMLYERDSKQSWEQLWNAGAEPWGHPAGRQQVRLKYNRHVVMPYARQKAQAMVNRHGWGPTSNVIVLFCGFGWIVEALKDLGVGEVVGIENSQYILDNIAFNEDAELIAAIEAVGLTVESGDGQTLFGMMRNNGNPRVNQSYAIVSSEPLDTNASRTRVKDLFSDNDPIDVITYDGWFQAYENSEIVQISDYINRIRGVQNVYHEIYDGGWGYNTNTMSIAEWEALLPNDIIVPV